MTEHGVSLVFRRSHHHETVIHLDEAKSLVSFLCGLGFYNYFGIGVNCAKQMNNFGYIMEYSMYKTFAAKYRSMPRIIHTFVL